MGILFFMFCIMVVFEMLAQMWARADKRGREDD